MFENTFWNDNWSVCLTLWMILFVYASKTKLLLIKKTKYILSYFVLALSIGVYFYYSVYSIEPTASKLDYNTLANHYISVPTKSCYVFLLFSLTYLKLNSKYKMSEGMHFKCCLQNLAIFVLAFGLVARTSIKTVMAKFWSQVCTALALHWLILKWLGHFFSKCDFFSDAVHLMCNIFIWNWSNTMHV